MKEIKWFYTCLCDTTNIHVSSDTEITVKYELIVFLISKTSYHIPVIFKAAQQINEREFNENEVFWIKLTKYWNPL